MLRCHVAMKILKSPITTRAHSGADPLLYFTFSANSFVTLVLGDQSKMTLFVDLRLCPQFGFSL